MAKSILPTNFKDDILGATMDNLRRYKMIENSDGTVSLQDVTDYAQVGSDFGAAQMNATNTAVNESVDKAVVIDGKDDLIANTTSGKVAGALAVKNIVNELKSNIDALNAGGGAPGASLKWHSIPSGQNLVMGCWATGLYRYSGYSAGAPDDYAGVMLTVGNVGSANDYMKVAFTLMCSVYVMRQDSSGNITVTWIKQ